MVAKIEEVALLFQEVLACLVTTRGLRLAMVHAKSRMITIVSINALSNVYQIQIGLGMRLGRLVQIAKSGRLMYSDSVRGNARKLNK